MKKKANNNITTLEEIIESKYGRRGLTEREE